MKVVILAGGLGSRLSEETTVRPKPMVELGGKPVLWHIMKIYTHYGLTDFVICLGYKGYIIKEYFANYLLHSSDVTLDFKHNSTIVHQHSAEPWTVTLVDTGDRTQTGGRLGRVRQHLGDETFCMTYGDGLGDVNISELLAFHSRHKTQATLTAVMPPGRFGVLDMTDEKIHRFEEKPPSGDGWINGGFFVLEPSVLDLLEDDATVWEREPLESLAAQGQLSAYKHGGFWQPMDTLRDKLHLEDLWNSGAAPWKVWK